MGTAIEEIKAPSLKELAKDGKEILSPGHRACAGCAGATTLRQVLLAAQTPVVTAAATGCMEVVTTIYPFSAWRSSYIHCAFENVAATMSGVETAFHALKKRGKIPADRQCGFICFAGDGGTYDIGFQALSGMLERGHHILYVCYDNNAYMNTGIQRSSATPLGAATNTEQAGTVGRGKSRNRKELTKIAVMHNIPYVAQASPHNVRDLAMKVRKGLAAGGPAFLNVLAPCHRGWRVMMDDSIEIAKTAVECCFWPLYEVENGFWKVNYKPKEKMPVADWALKQGRFGQFKKQPDAKELQELQKIVDEDWEWILQQERDSIARREAQKP